ncbi:MAG: hypothetical protein M3537_05595 [Chloroflexota bacterium]|nr:hypothetical protein [Chloroflexota bacterium]
MVASQGTYTTDGEKIVLTMDGQTHTLLKTGNCLEDQRHVFSRMCIGGKAGEVANASGVASAPAEAGPSGTWRATSDQGDFTLVFKPGNTPRSAWPGG